MPEPYYCTDDDLRSKLDLDSTALPDADATALIQLAEELIDDWLGGLPVDETTFRKVAQDDVQDYQWAAINTATIRLAARLYSEPDLITGRTYSSIGGPDFSLSGATSQATVLFGRDVLVALRASNLKRAGGHARANRYWRSSLFNDAIGFLNSNGPSFP